MRLIIKRTREYRHGWSYRAFDWEILLDGAPLGLIRDNETLSFDVSGEEHMLEIRVAKIPRAASQQVTVPAGAEAIAFECKMIHMPQIALIQADVSAE